MPTLRRRRRRRQFRSLFLLDEGRTLPLARLERTRCFVRIVCCCAHYLQGLLRARLRGLVNSDDYPLPHKFLHQKLQAGHANR